MSWKTIKEYFNVIKKMLNIDDIEDDQEENVEIGLKMLIGLIGLMFIIIALITLNSFFVHNVTNKENTSLLKEYCCEKRGTYIFTDDNFIYCGAAQQGRYPWSDFERFLKEEPEEYNASLLYKELSKYNISCYRFYDNYSGCNLYRCD